MTFYWWSHWFWITILSTILLSITTIVHTYPSQEISLEYNQNSKSIKAITKLHQTTTPLEWSTTTTTATITTSTTISTPTASTKRESEKEVAIIAEEAVQQKSGEASVENISKELAAEDEEDALDASGVEPDDPELQLDAAVEEENIVEADNAPNAEQLEYKRSAEVINKTIDEDAEEDEDDEGKVEEPRVEAVMVQPRSASIDEGSSKLNRDVDELSNYTNHSRSAVDVRANKNCTNCKNATHDFNRTTSAKSASISASSSSTMSLTPKPATHSIEPPTHTETLEWLNAMAAAAAVPASKLLTNAPQQTSSEIDRGTISVATEPTLTAVGATTMTAQRIPFTLENANKEEELRRAENEHRSRKSKVLSAEYKHINRFINYSSDTKSLLTRSAAIARNDFDGGEENNISSEALSIQRTYFMDAGAVSAICFTIFGVCCTVGTIGIVLYRRRYLNKPQALSEPDSSVYIDDSTMRDNSDEMYSLDNDSFLNSLEAMTIQNYWTDTVKHTKL